MAAALAVCIAAGCGQGGDTDRATGRGVELMLYCGAGIRPAAERLTAAFEAQRGVKIRPTYAGSGFLLGQIASHSKGDLFMPGAEWYVDRAVARGLAVGQTKRVVAVFVPVIMVAKGNPRGIRSLADLGRSGLRVVLGDERACAVGRKTLKILEKSGIPYERIKPNVVSKTGTVNELGVAIQLGTADAVIIWDANARHFAEYGDMVAIPPEQNAPSTIPIVLLRSSRHTREARGFIEFAPSAEGRRILRDTGYTMPRATDGPAARSGAGTP